MSFTYFRLNLKNVLKIQLLTPSPHIPHEEHSCASASNAGTTQTQPHQISNTQHTENKTTDMVIQQHSRKLLMMDILMSETCWAHKKLNKIASDIKLVFHSSTNTVISSFISLPKYVFLCASFYGTHKC
jgi:hypothetical protein